MHEVSVMGWIIDEVISVAKKNHAERVLNVILEVGDLTFLGKRQLRFAYDILSGLPEYNILKDSKISIRQRKGMIKCTVCNYKGPLLKRTGINHMFPVFLCPKCSGKVEVVSGRECMLKNIKIEPKGMKKK